MSTCRCTTKAGARSSSLSLPIDRADKNVRPPYCCPCQCPPLSVTFAWAGENGARQRIDTTPPAAPLDACISSSALKPALEANFRLSSTHLYSSASLGGLWLLLLSIAPCKRIPLPANSYGFCRLPAKAAPRLGFGIAFLIGMIADFSERLIPDIIDGFRKKPSQ